MIDDSFAIAVESAPFWSSSIEAASAVAPPAATFASSVAMSVSDSVDASARALIDRILSSAATSAPFCRSLMPDALTVTESSAHFAASAAICPASSDAARARFTMPVTCEIAVATASFWRSIMPFASTAKVAALVARVAISVPDSVAATVRAVIAEILAMPVARAPFWSPSMPAAFTATAPSAAFARRAAISVASSVEVIERLLTPVKAVEPAASAPSWFAFIPAAFAVTAEPDTMRATSAAYEAEAVSSLANEAALISRLP